MSDKGGAMGGVRGSGYTGTSSEIYDKKRLEVTPTETSFSWGRWDAFFQQQSETPLGRPSNAARMDSLKTGLPALSTASRALRRRSRSSPVGMFMIRRLRRCLEVVL